MIGAAVLDLHARFDRDRALAVLDQVSALDRYQASEGIEAAANIVAEHAERAGLHDVTVHRWTVDGDDARWWTFRAPAPWTPVRASLAVDDRPLVDYPRDPFALAVYSAATAGTVRVPLVAAGDGRQARGAVVVLTGGEGLSSALVTDLERAGAVGVVASPGWRDARDQAIRRIELPPSATCFAFSIPPAAMRALTDLLPRGAVARAEVVVRRRGRMPVVTGVRPGDEPGDVVVHAHLCHPRPSANDNGSGVAGAVELAYALARRGTGRRPLRFVWGAELVGTAAYLHDLVGAGRAPAPAALINLDMIGEDVTRCGGALTVERGPLDAPGFVAALVEACLTHAPAPEHTYGGAERLPAAPWVAVPFVGASDHLLFAEPPVAVPVASLGHHPDRFNHSSLDTVDKVDPDRLRTTAAAAGAAANVLSRAAGPNDAMLLAVAAAGAAMRRISAIAVRALSTRASPDDVFDPYAPGHAQRYLRAVAAAADQDVTAAAKFAGALPYSLRGLRSALAAAAGGFAGGLPAADAPMPDGGPALSRAWAGPFNLLAALGDLDPAAYRAIGTLLQRNRGTAYALLVALALAVDGHTGSTTVIERAAFSSGLAIPAGVARTWLAALREAGWITTAGRSR